MNQYVSANLRNIFKTFRTVYPHFFGKNIFSKKNIEEWGQIWAEVISDLTDVQIKSALKFCISTSDYPPTPNFFRRKALGIIDLNAAYHRAVEEYRRYCIYKRNNGESNAGYKYQETFQPIITSMWAVDWNKTEKEAKESFLAIYGDIINKMLQGENNDSRNLE